MERLSIKKKVGKGSNVWKIPYHLLTLSLAENISFSYFSFGQNYTPVTLPEGGVTLAVSVEVAAVVPGSLTLHISEYVQRIM